ncbi:MAG: PEP-CTERM sorting domain-containing protein [Pirellulales bacterium]
MNRFVTITSSMAAAMVLSAAFGSGATAAPLVMTINHDASSLTLDGQLSGFVFLDQAAGSRTTKYTGSITVDVDNLLSPSTISILSASADADVNGTWLPKLGGQVPSNSPTVQPPAPADYGVKAQFNGNDAAFAAGRGLVLNLSSGAEAVGGGGSFNSSETMTVSAGLFESWITPLLGGGGGSDDITGDIYPRDAATPTMSSYVVAGNTATLTIPIRARRTDGTSFTLFTGTLVATAVVPEPATILLVGAALVASLGIRRRK